MDMNWELVAQSLQQRIANLVAQYEGQIAVMNAQIAQLQQALPTKDEGGEDDSPDNHHHSQ